MRKIAAILTLLTPFPAAAEVELSFYGGAQSAPHSDVIFEGDDVIPDDEIFVGWEGRSFSAPPYYGLRATWWRDARLGYGVDFTHSKVYADELPDGFDRLEFTDGLNTLTANAYYRWPDGFAGATPYLGGGLGVTIPYVEVDYDESETRGYQIAGPAAVLLGGVSYPVDENWSVFAEYKFSYVSLDADLETGGTVESDIITNAINLGVSYSF